MKKLTLGQIREAVNGSLIKGNAENLIEGISIDSRSAKKGDVFFCITGERLDGHEFVLNAIENGVKSIVLSKEDAVSNISNEKLNDINIILVSDTTKALQELSKYYLKLLNIKTIGVTGSTGKTTTKDMLYYICRRKFKTGRNLENFNNHIGLPLTILSFEEGTEVGILEMGMSEIGEISVLAEIARPEVGVITNIGTSHIENLGNRDNILKAKMEITENFGKENTLVVCEDREYLTPKRTSGNYKLITIGSNMKSNFILSDVVDHGEDGIEFTLEYKYDTQKFKLPISGRHNGYNGALAVAAAMELGVTMAEAACGLAEMVLTEKRLSIKGKDSIKVIDDTYNASPDSVRAAIEVLVSTKGMRKVAMLADMLELGKDSPKYHKEIGTYAGERNLDLIICVGEASKYMYEGAKAVLGEDKVMYFTKREILMEELPKIVHRGDVILLKGSRGMQMDKVVKKILE